MKLRLPVKISEIFRQQRSKHACVACVFSTFFKKVKAVKDHDNSNRRSPAGPAVQQDWLVIRANPGSRTIV